MKETLVFISGILLTLVPYLGIPEVWRQRTIFGIGVLLIFIGYLLRRTIYLRNMERENGERGADSFVETTEQLIK